MHIVYIYIVSSTRYGYWTHENNIKLCTNSWNDFAHIHFSSWIAWMAWIMLIRKISIAYLINKFYNFSNLGNIQCSTQTFWIQWIFGIYALVHTPTKVHYSNISFWCFSCIQVYINNLFTWLTCIELRASISKVNIFKLLLRIHRPHIDESERNCIAYLYELISYLMQFSLDSENKIYMVDRIFLRYSSVYALDSKSSESQVLEHSITDFLD